MSSMTSPKSAQASHFSPKAVAGRQARREARKAAFAGAATALATESSAFSQRYAFSTGGHVEEGRKIQGNPGACANAFVLEALGEFSLVGNMRPRFIGSHRTAGYGAHGILDGSLHVEVELHPLVGMEQRIEVPVQVKNGHMQPPGMFYWHDVPMILSQSALDDVMQGSSFKLGFKLDRQNLFQPPGPSRRTPRN